MNAPIDLVLRLTLRVVQDCCCGGRLHHAFSSLSSSILLVAGRLSDLRLFDDHEGVSTLDCTRTWVGIGRVMRARASEVSDSCGTTAKKEHYL